MSVYEQINEKEEAMADEMIKAETGKNFKETVLYKLRLNKLDSTSRTLQKHNITDSQGYLTIEGAQVFLDAMWQSDEGKVLQEKIAAELKAMEKEKKAKKDEDK